MTKNYKNNVSSRVIFYVALQNIVLCSTYDIAYFLFRGTTVTSQQKDSHGNPFFELKNGNVSVRNFEEAANFLQVAKEKRLNETRLCLEGKFTSVFKYFML